MNLASHNAFGGPRRPYVCHIEKARCDLSPWLHTGQRFNYSENLREGGFHGAASSLHLLLSNITPS